MKTKVVEEKELEKISPIFKGKRGHKLAKFVMHLFAIDRVNRVYGRSCNYTGADFSEKLLKDLGVTYLVGNAERLQQLPKGAFITVSNHPYGGLDGIMIIDLMVRIRPDYKFMVNRLLSLVKTMEENFITVTSRTDNNNGYSTTSTSLKGIRETLTRLQDGHPVGFFPSGAVSDFSFKNLRVRDREWQESILKLIQTAKVPVVPIRFFNQNSPFFYFLGLIDWRIRIMRMPYEVFNKKGKNPRIGIGEIISVEQQAKFSDYRSFGTFLRDAVYKMPKPTSFTPKTELKIT
ncbi:MAG: 1-acyl-sn-glycerol-3-phosphate acyltransferase [Rikenellaceae bacterium]